MVSQASSVIIATMASTSADSNAAVSRSASSRSVGEPGGGAGSCVEADFGAGKVTMPGSRLHLLDDDSTIKCEPVVFDAAR